MKMFHLCSLVSIADKENGVGLVFFLHHSSSVSRDWEEETRPSFLRIPQVQGIWRQWICEGLSASFSAHSKNAPVVKKEKKKMRKKTLTKTPKTVLVLNLAAFNTSWMISSETALVPRLWHGPLTLWCKISLFSASSGETWNLHPHLHLQSSVTPFSVLEYNLLELKKRSQGFLGLFSLLCRLSGILNTHDDPY